MVILSTRKKYQSIAVREAVRALRHGGVIAFPTETTYGLGCDPRNAKAVARIFMIKGREKKKSLILVASSIVQVKKIAHLVGANLAFARMHWPGPLTLVLPKKNKKGDVAIRVSSSKFVQELTSAYGFPIIATSANRSGEPDCRSGKAVVRIFDGRKDVPDLVIDMGVLPRRKPSTVARIGEDGRIEILRK